MSRKEAIEKLKVSPYEGMNIDEEFEFIFQIGLDIRSIVCDYYSD